MASDINVTTLTVFGMGEATWSWYRPSARKSPLKVAELIADLAMRTLLREPGMLHDIKKSAKAGGKP